MSLNAIPSAERLHIGFFGRTNSGKSSLVNMVAGQSVSIVSEVAGTTTDVVSKPLELPGLGACVLLDTAGFGDDTPLAKERAEKTRLAGQKTDLAVLAVSAEDLPSGKTDTEPVLREEFLLAQKFAAEKIPVVVAVTKCDRVPEPPEEILRKAEKFFTQEKTKASTDGKNENAGASIDAAAGENCDCGLVLGTNVLFVATSSKSLRGAEELRAALCRLVPENFGSGYITGSLVSEGDVVLLVMPQDRQAPKGRLILPQVQVIRELLDRKCVVISATTEKMSAALSALAQPPKIIITDSQAFKEVFAQKPEGVPLTSFSVLFAAYKGDLPYYAEGACAIDSLTPASRVLIAECCTHAPATEDIGRVKIPRLLRERAGASLEVEIASGSDFPSDLSRYDLIVQCGGCMFNRRHVISRIETARAAKVPMTNYGVALAHLTGILEHIAMV